MPEYTADEEGRLRLLNIKIHQAVSSMAQAQFVKVSIARKKCRLVQLLEQGDNVWILHPFAPHFNPDLAHGDTPLA